MDTFFPTEYSETGRELREHGTKEFPAACYRGDLCQRSVPLHWHRELEAGFVVEGRVEMFVGPERFRLEAGQGFFINTGIPHGFSAAEGAEAGQQCSVVFDPILVDGRFDSVFWQRYIQPVLSAAAMPCLILSPDILWQAQALAFLQEAWQVCTGEGPDYELAVRHNLTRLLAQVSSHLPAQPTARTRRAFRDKERILKMLTYIQAHFSENLTADDIAASAMISPSECLRCFHNTIGLTPIQYTKYYRVQRAAQMLQTTDRKISEIGESCGFQEMSYFAKTFREYMKVSPYEYRRQNTEAHITKEGDRP